MPLRLEAAILSRTRSPGRPVRIGRWPVVPLGFIDAGAKPKEPWPVPGRAGDGPRDGGESCVRALAPDIAARHDRDGVPLALILPHQHGAGLEAPAWRLGAPSEAIQNPGS